MAPHVSFQFIWANDTFVAGVAPLSGLYAAFIVGLITAIFGGRPGMISGATGALAVVMVSLVVEHGVE